MMKKLTDATLVALMLMACVSSAELPDVLADTVHAERHVHCADADPQCVMQQSEA